jgi:hypothetical protein
MSKWFTEGSMPRPTGDWRWRISMFSSRPILQILVRREPFAIPTAWIPGLVTRVAPFLMERGTEARTVTSGETINARDGLILNVDTAAAHA